MSNHAATCIDAQEIHDETTDKATDDKDDVENTQNGDRKLTAEENNKIVKLFEDSATSYKTYLKKGNGVSDREEIERKIEYLQSQISKYTNPEEQQQIQ